MRRTHAPPAPSSFVSPHLDTEIVRFANERDCMVVPGAFTPTEVFTALQAGAHIVKVFPANIVGPQFFKDLQGPFGPIPLLPTGGITIENAATYIQSGALALGVGAGLLNWQGLKYPVRACDGSDTGNARGYRAGAARERERIARARHLRRVAVSTYPQLVQRAQVVAQ